MGRKKIMIGAVAFALVVVTAVALAVVVPRLRAGRNTPPVAPIAATLRVITPAALVGQEAELLAAAVSRRPLARFELWSGGERVAEARPIVDGNRGAAVLRWTPQSAGTHLLVLRAIDDLGHAAPVRMRTAELPEASVPLGNGLVGPSLVGRRELAAAPVGSADPADPAAPTVTTVVAKCTLRISADTGSLPTLALYIAAPGLPGFQALRYGDTGHSEARLPLVAGDVAVYALGYGGQESAASPILSVAPPAECADSRWQGDVSLVDGRLFSQPGPPDLAYLYLSIDGGPWHGCRPRTRPSSGGATGCWTSAGCCRRWAPRSGSTSRRGATMEPARTRSARAR
ncbi:MAG: hypothetical protein IRY85_23180 [Micromonosporaceae bacterium]|nr:hypothetical protein [Micromonosporaceae bacterium]